MDILTINQMARSWAKENKNLIPPTPEAKFITGNWGTDMRLHQFELDSGLALKLNNSTTAITGYEIVNEKKFAWFTLKYA